MDLIFSIHDIFNVALYDIPERIYPFLFNEYKYYEKEFSGQINLEIHFVDKIAIPEGSTLLWKGFYYKDGMAFLSMYGAVLKVPLKDIPFSRIHVFAEKNVFVWFIVYVVERILFLKVLEQGYCFFHAAGLVKDDRAILNSTLQMGGKTDWILRELKKAGNF